MENIIKQIIELCTEKLKELGHILDLKKKQKEVILKEDLEGIQSVLNAIDRCIKSINKIDLAINDKIKEIKITENIESLDQIDDKKFPSIVSLRNKFEEIKSVLKEIKVYDDENRFLMNEKLEESKSRLKDIRQGQKMVKGYFTNYNNNIFIDERN